MRASTRSVRSDSEKKLIEIAHQMIPGLHMSDRYRLRMAACAPHEFFMDRSNLSAQLEKLSDEKLGFIIGQALRDERGTLWRNSRILGWGRADIDDDGGRETLVYLASIVIAAAVYDILATEHVIGIEQGSIAQFVTYQPPLLLRNFVSRVRLGMKR